MKKCPKIARVWTLAIVLCFLAGCGQSDARRYPIGARIYEQGTHRYLGRVLAFESAHSFNNGLGPQPAVLIEPPEPADAGKEGEIWLGCDYMNNYEVKTGNKP